MLNVFACHPGVPVTSVHLVDSQYEPDAQAGMENCGPFLSWAKSCRIRVEFLFSVLGPFWASLLSCQEVQGQHS